MTPNEYQELCLTTLVTDNQRDTLTMCGLGIAGEAGEVCDIIKKGLFHKGKPINPDKLADELGDLCWYVAVAAYALHIQMDNISPVLQFSPNGIDLAKTGLLLAKRAGDIVDSIDTMRQTRVYESTDYVTDSLHSLTVGIAILASCMDMSFEAILKRNIAKLQARHSGGQQTANGGVFNPHYLSDSTEGITG